MTTDQQREKDRQIIMAAMKTAAEMIPDTGFITLAVKAEPEAGADAYQMQIVTSMRPEFTIKVLRQTLEAAMNNLAQFEKQTRTLRDDPDDL